jgi:hypothetical protein
MARGGLQEKPLTPAHAFGIEGPTWAALTLNTGFNVLRSKPTKILSKSSMNAGDVRNILDQFRTPSSDLVRKRDNIVIIVVESLGLESMAKVFEIDRSRCQHCKGEMSIVAAIIKRSEVARYLKHLGIEHEPSARAPPRDTKRNLLSLAPQTISTKACPS